MLTGLTGWRMWGAATISGAISALAMAPSHMAPILLLTLPVLLGMTRPDVFGVSADAVVPSAADVPDPTISGLGATVVSRMRRGFTAGWWFGFGYHFAGLYWIGGAFLVQADSYAWLLPAAVTLMPAGLALFFGAATAACAALPDRWVDPRIGFVLCLSAAEVLRGTILTGFPWNSLGYALAWPLPLMQAASVFGIYGLTVLAIVIAVFPLTLYVQGCRQNARRPAIVAGLALVIPVGVLATFGGVRLAMDNVPDVPDVRVRLVQPSVPQADKWRQDRQSAIFRQHLDLTRQRPDGGTDDLSGITHVIWPEAAMPFGPLASPSAIAAVREALPDGTVLLAGLLRAERDRRGLPTRIFNSAVAFEHTGRVQALYDKIHLVPFGEYLPFQQTLERLGLEAVTRQRGGFAAGRGPRQLMEISGLPRTEMLICYEVVFPQGVGRGAVRPQLFVNLTNDGWFGVTSGPYQHLHQAQVRAVENGVPLLRVANNGVSAVVDAFGRIRHSLDLNVVGTIDSSVPAALPQTIYSAAREALFMVIWGLFLLLGMLLRSLSKPCSDIA
ncbi:MAG: apolipoprotein N-acyltransferase [Pseudomonadota bacterium]